MDVANLISASSAFSKSSLNIWNPQFTYCWSLARRILSITFLACEMSATVRSFVVVKINLLLFIDICTSVVAICGLFSMIYLYKSLPIVHFWHHSFKTIFQQEKPRMNSLSHNIVKLVIGIRQTYVWIMSPTILTHPGLVSTSVKPQK